MSKENYLVYIAFGNDDFRNEALSSILSYLLLKPKKEEATIIVYTDQVSHFKPLAGAPVSIIYEEIAPQQWQLWRGRIDFVHRIKIEVIRATVLKYGGNIIYLDSDTFFLKDPAVIFQALSSGKRFMHIYESTLKTSKGFHYSVYSNLIKYNTASWYQDLVNAKMYNAGVIGVSAGDALLLDQILQLTDTLYGLYPTHVMEQLSFSMSMPQNGQLGEAAPYLLHYWHMKDIRPVLADFFKKHAGSDIRELLLAYSKIPVLKASDEKNEWERKRRWQRALLRIAGLGWKWPSEN
jgi:hypothetical protein